ncbi:hypothetical protein M201_gp82 [Haloarcula californiae tailed virus 2]|uniref:Uncharacterized protein n=1 Tax=Haloarcula californiae tailed virus 2 TaxID=1273747 RepID=R4TNN9_9CAUD|nr:hypothetical protein M201_gp82 [Haloarcula californiae tailed virus 2]AGM11848.1 hypothetical protein HCTV2_81 [Haloarcula californiae tailed virus 2]
MYSNVSHYGGDAHIWTREQAERLRQAGPHETSATSLCEHHAVTEASDLFHVSDVAPDWQSFLEEDTVCDECAQAWREYVGVAEQENEVPENWFQRAVREAGRAAEQRAKEQVPVHPNARCSTVPQQGEDDSPPDAADAARYATASYARFVEFGQGDEGDSGPPPAAAAAPLLVDPDQYSIAPQDLTIQHRADVAQAEGGIDPSIGQVEHSFSFDVSLDEQEAERLAKLLGDRADRAVRDRR